jgi:hypothetical protein
MASPDSSKQTADAGMCTHGNFPGSCSKCAHTESGNSPAAEEGSEINLPNSEALQNILRDVESGLDSVEKKLTSGSPVTAQEIFAVMYKMDGALSDAYGDAQNNQQKQNPVASGQPRPRSKEGQAYHEAYNRRAQIVDKLPRKTLETLRVLLAGGTHDSSEILSSDELVEIETTPTEFIEEFSTEFSLDQLKQFGYEAEEISTSSSEDLMATIKDRQEKGEDVVFLDENDLSKIAVKKPIPGNQGKSLIQENGFMVLKESNKNAVNLRSTMEQAIKSGQYSELQFTNTTILAKEKTN